MNQLCKVCGEPAAGFHFGAFTCEGCKSFFGRTYNNISAIAGCKNNGDCVINKKNRTACKACRLRKCLLVGMSKSGSRYGRRSNWFKIHCLLQEQHSHQGVTSPSGADGSEASGGGGGTGTNFEQLARLHQIQARQTYQDKTNPCIKSESMSPTLSLSAASLSQQAAAVAAAAAAAAATAAQQHHHQHQHHQQHGQQQHHQQQQQQQQQQQHQQHQNRQHQPHQQPHLLQHPQHEPQRLPPHYLNAAKFLNGVASEIKSESRLSAATPSDSGASSAGDAADDSHSNRSSRTGRGSIQSSATPLMRNFGSEKQREEEEEEEEEEGSEEAAIDQDREQHQKQQQQQQQQPSTDFSEDLHESRRRQFLHIFRSHSEPLHTFAPTKNPFASFAISNLQHSPLPPMPSGTPPMLHFLPASLKTNTLRNAPDEQTTLGDGMQHEPIDLSLRTRATLRRQSGDSPAAATAADDEEDDRLPAEMRNRDVIARPDPLDLTLVRTSSLTG